MQIKKIEKEGYRLHLIKSKNFKTVYVKLLFWNKIKEDEVTLRNVLFNNLLFSSNKYKTPRELAIKKADLYGLSLVSGINRKSDYILSEVTMSFIDEKYTEKGLMEDSFSFLFDILNNPNIKNNQFDQEIFDINKEMTISNIKRELENPNSFALKNYKKLLNSSNPYNISLTGNQINLDKITPSNLYEYYKSFFKNNNIDIIVLGNIDFKKVEDIITEKFKFKGKKNYPNNLYLSYDKKLTEDIISGNFNQSKLIMGGSTKNLSKREKKYAALIYNIILGNSPKSKLFQNVREKHSYAYSISSNFNRLDGLFIIFAGISKENFEKTKMEVLNQMEEIKKGNFEESDIDNAKAFILSVIEETEDYPDAIIDRYFSNLYFDTDNEELQKEEVLKVSKKDIIEAAKKIKIDTILLVEEKNERNKNK